MNKQDKKIYDEYKRLAEVYHDKYYKCNHSEFPYALKRKIEGLLGMTIEEATKEMQQTVREEFKNTFLKDYPFDFWYEYSNCNDLSGYENYSYEQDLCKLCKNCNPETRTDMVREIETGPHDIPWTHIVYHCLFKLEPETCNKFKYKLGD